MPDGHAAAAGANDRAHAEPLEARARRCEIDRARHADEAAHDVGALARAHLDDGERVESLAFGDDELTRRLERQVHERVIAAFATQRDHLAARQLALADLDDLPGLHVKRQLVGGHVEHRLLIGADGVHEAGRGGDRVGALAHLLRRRAHLRHHASGNLLRLG